MTILKLIVCKNCRDSYFDRNVDKLCNYTRFELHPNIASILSVVEDCRNYQSKQHDFPASRTPPIEY